MDNKLTHQIYMDIFQPSAERIGMSLLNVTGKLTNRFDNWCNRLDKDVLLENQVTPPANILVPILEGMVYNEDGTLLQEMFYNLLKNSIDKTRQEFNHPSFPKILGQLSKEELIILCRCYKIHTYEKYAFPPTRISMDYTSVIITHLIGLGLISKQLDIQTRTEQRSLLHPKYNLNKEENPIVEVSKNEWIEMNPFGEQFIESCMSGKTEELIKDLI